jgi:acid stress-induced BolA-like protein IbaG/YrbA
MTAEELQNLIAENLPCEHITVTGDGRHWSARHQRVYATLGTRIQNDEVHALSMKTFTPAEWAATQV